MLGLCVQWLSLEEGVITVRPRLRSWRKASAVGQGWSRAHLPGRCVLEGGQVPGWPGEAWPSVQGGANGGERHPLSKVSGRWSVEAVVLAVLDFWCGALTVGPQLHGVVFHREGPLTFTGKRTGRTRPYFLPSMPLYWFFLSSFSPSSFISSFIFLLGFSSLSLAGKRTRGPAGSTINLSPSSFP